MDIGSTNKALCSAILVVSALMGCAQILGLEEWNHGVGNAQSGSTGGTGGTGGATGSTGESLCDNSNPNDPTCADCTKNGLETDVDCGGDSCLPCANERSCLNDADCTSGFCDNGSCGPAPPPTCNMEVPCLNCQVDEDNGETDVDCGGDACPPCDAAKACRNDADCMSGVCDNLVCD